MLRKVALLVWIASVFGEGRLKGGWMQHSESIDTRITDSGTVEHSKIIAAEEERMKTTTSDDDELHCAPNGLMSMYRGNLDTAEKGIKCKPWTNKWIQDYPGYGLGSHSFCRAPPHSFAFNGRANVLAFCLTDEPEGYSHCNVAECTKGVEIDKQSSGLTVKNQIHEYFLDKRKIDELCVTFEQQYKADICEFDEGKRRDNRNGFDEETVESFFWGNYYSGSNSLPNYPTQSDPWSDISSNLNDGTNTNTGNQVCKMSEVKFPYKRETDRARLGLSFDNVNDDNMHKEDGSADRYLHQSSSIIILYAYSGATDQAELDEARKNIEKNGYNRMKYCTALAYMFTPEFIPIHVTNLSTDWKLATYQTMKAADTVVPKTASYDTFKVYMNRDKYVTIVILPDSVNFKSNDTYGFGMVHDGFSVIKSSFLKQPQFLLHELGHNLGMKHSSTQNDKYGDTRCIMGSPKGNNYCFNGPKSWYLQLYERISITPNECQNPTLMVDVHDWISDRYSDYLNRLSGAMSLQFIYDNNVFPLVQVKKNENDQLYMMYYKDDDVVVITKGKIGKIVNDRKILEYEDDSLVVCELGPDEKVIYEEVLFKRCRNDNTNFKLARVVVSTNTNIATTC